MSELGKSEVLRFLRPYLNEKESGLNESVGSGKYLNRYRCNIGDLHMYIIYI